MSQTFFEKAWRDHAIADLGENTHLLQVDRLILHDVTGGGAQREHHHGTSHARSIRRGG